MTPSELEIHLSRLPADAPLVFETNAGAIGPGYHVTEWKIAQVDSIDCGGQKDAWSEASLQLLDGPMGQHMSVGKFRGILTKSIAAMPALGDSAFKVEFAHGNQGMQIFAPQAPSLSDTRVVLKLAIQGATCKPAARVNISVSSCCCTTPETTSACCG